MTENSEEFFIGIMILKEGKWAPVAKYPENSFGSALIKAEELNGIKENEGVKIMKLPTSKSSGAAPKEMWISPHLANKAEAAAAAKLSQGVKQTQKNFTSAHEARKASFRKK